MEKDMKKKIKTLVAGICAMALLVGCGTSDGSLSNSKIIINKYKGLEVEKVTPVEVTDEDINLSIKSDIQINWEKVEGIVYSDTKYPFEVLGPQVTEDGVRICSTCSDC